MASVWNADGADSRDLLRGPLPDWYSNRRFRNEVGAGVGGADLVTVLPFDAAKGLQLGRIKTGATTWGEYWPGVIDDVWVFGGVASDTQIAALASGVDLDTTAGP